MIATLGSVATNVRATSLALFLTLAVGGCGDDPNPTGPSQNQLQHRVSIRGVVTDSLRHPLNGALVEVLDGPSTGMKVLTDGAGRFELRTLSTSDPLVMGQVAEAVILRASHDGFQSRTLQDFWSFEVGSPLHLPRSEQVIWLDSGPTINLDPGAYTLTAAINLASARDWLPNSRAPCKGFPAEFASRSFQVTVDLRDRALDYSSVKIDNQPPGSGFGLYRVGRFFLAEIEDGFSGMFEDLPGFRYLMIGGTVTGTEPAIETGTSVTVPFHATFQYCKLKYERGIANNCEQVPADGVVEFHACDSDRATLTFTKR
jgi:hypothetical protein